MAEDASNNAVIPVPNTQKDFYNWAERHKTKTEAARARQHELIFIGDSITHMFEVPERGGKVWEQHFGHYTTLNLGYGWDCTQNVLWRLANGEFAYQRPRVVVLNIGTNNLTGNSGGRANTAEEIIEAILAICDFIHRHSPETQIIVMSVFPRGATTEPIFQQAKELAGAIQQAVTGQSGLTNLDIGTRFLGSDGEIPTALMDDLVHPTEAGYQIWAEELGPIISKLI